MEITIAGIARPGSSSLKTTIPEYMVKRYGIKPGDKLVWAEKGNEMKVEKLEKDEDDFELAVETELLERPEIFKEFESAESIRSIR